MDQQLLQTANSDSRKVFRPQPNRAQLRVSVVERVENGSGKRVICSTPEKEINKVAELVQACHRKSNEHMRVYTIQHVRTWSGLDISFELLQRLMEVERMFAPLWRILFTFKVKFSENEYGFPLPQRRRSKSDSTHTEELAYVMRRVEENGRPGEGCPWSIRQTGIYQQFVRAEGSTREPRLCLLLVAPSAALGRSLSDDSDSKALEPEDAAFAVHRRVVAEGLAGWMGYMCWFEEQLKLKEATIIAPPLHGDFENRNIGFLEVSRHELKKLEDMITDMNVILDTKVRNISWLKTSRERYCLERCAKPGQCTCRQTVDELEDRVDEARMYQERAKVLQSRVHSVQSLLSDILSYEEARTSKDLMFSAVQGNKAMEQLAIIGLIFMPITLVENFFSTEFVKDDGGTMHVSKCAWMLAAVAVPLTAWVIVFWRLWLRCQSSGIFQRLGDRLRGRKLRKEELFFDV